MRYRAWRDAQSTEYLDSIWNVCAKYRMNYSGVRYRLSAARDNVMRARRIKIPN